MKHIVDSFGFRSETESICYYYFEENPVSLKYYCFRIQTYFDAVFPFGTMLDYDLNARSTNLHNYDLCILQLNAKMHRTDDLDDLDRVDFIFVYEFRIISTSSQLNYVGKRAHTK